MKKLLIINYYYPPIVNGGVQRTFNFKKYLSEMGYEVDFLTTGSYGAMENDKAEGVLRFPDAGLDYTQSGKHSKAGVFLFRAFRLMLVKTGIITDGKYFWRREAEKELNEIMTRKKYDVVLASHPTPANLELGEKIHKRFGVPLVVDYRDGIMYEPFEEVANSFFVVRRRLLSLEKRMAKMASLHITVNREMNNYYEAHYPEVRSVIIPNGFDDEEVIDCAPVDLPAGKNVVLTGSIGKSRKLYSFEELKKGLETLFSISQDVNFVFIGDYEEQEKDFFTTFSNVFVFEKTNRKTVIATQKAADALLLISGPKGATSGKLYEYLFSGRPILNLGGMAGIAEIINGKQFGITCAPEDKEKMREFIQKLKDGELVFETENLRQYTRRYQSEMLARELDKIIEAEYNYKIQGQEV